MQRAGMRFQHHNREQSLTHVIEGEFVFLAFFFVLPGDGITVHEENNPKTSAEAQENWKTYATCTAQIWMRKSTRLNPGNRFIAKQC